MRFSIARDVNVTQQMEKKTKRKENDDKIFRLTKNYFFNDRFSFLKEINHCAKRTCYSINYICY